MKELIPSILNASTSLKQEKKKKRYREVFQQKKNEFTQS